MTPGRVGDEERDRLGRRRFGGHDEVALVLAVLVVDDDDHLAPADRGHRVFYLGERHQAASSRRRSAPSWATETNVPRHRSAIVEHAGPGEQRPAVVAAEQRRREVEDVPIDEALRVEVVRHRRTAFDQHLENPSPAELVEDGLEVARQLDRRSDLGPVRDGAEDDPQRLARRRRVDTDGQRRVVRPDRPGADEHRVGPGPEPVGVLAGVVAGDPLARPVRRGRPPVHRRRQLEHDPRPAGPAVLQVRRQLLVDRRGTDPDVDRDPGRSQPVDAPAGDVRVRVEHADDDPGDPGIDDRVHAGRRPANVGARLERREQRRPPRLVPGGAERSDLGVRPARRRGRPLEPRPGGRHDDAAHPRVRRGRPVDRPGRRDGPGHVRLVRVNHMRSFPTPAILEHVPVFVYIRWSA